MAVDREAVLYEALRLASEGIPVFPCAPNAKTPLTKDGLYEATTDTYRIRQWWKWQPDANLATPTGHRWDVLDVDVRRSGSGFPAISMLKKASLLDGAKRCVVTPSGGWHIYFTASGSEGNHAMARCHIDFRGKGGYVLVPPSYVVDEAKGYEGVYTETDGYSDTKDVPFDWGACKRLLDPPRDYRPRYGLPVSNRVEHLVAWLMKQPEGNRNNATYWAACRIVERNGDLGPLEEAAISIGLDHEEVRKTIGSAERRGK